MFLFSLRFYFLVCARIITDVDFSLFRFLVVFIDRFTKKKNLYESGTPLAPRIHFGCESKKKGLFSGYRSKVEIQT